MIKGIVFFDIDGTLIDCPNGIFDPTEKTIKSFLKLKNNGYKIGIASGRPKSFIPESILKLPIDAFVTSNGSYVEIDGEVVFNNVIPDDIVNEVLIECKKNNMSIILEGQEVSFYKEEIDKEVMEFLDEFYICKNNMIDLNSYKKQVKTNKIVVFVHKEEVYRNFKNKFGNKFTFMIHPNNISWDMYISDFSKASGIEYVIEKLGLSDKDSYAFGDGFNDIEMFQMVDKGICMGYCNEVLEKYSFNKTETVKNEGVYLGLKKLNVI